MIFFNIEKYSNDNEDNIKSNLQLLYYLKTMHFSLTALELKTDLDDLSKHFSRIDLASRWSNLQINQQHCSFGMEL